MADKNILLRSLAAENISDGQVKLLCSEFIATYMLCPCFSMVAPSQLLNIERYQEDQFLQNAGLLWQTMLAQGLHIILAKTFLKLCYNLTSSYASFLPSLYHSGHIFVMLWQVIPPPPASSIFPLISIFFPINLAFLYLFCHLLLWGPELIFIPIGMKLKCYSKIHSLGSHSLPGLVI